MSNDPGDRPDDDANNPFRGTPFEQMFAAFSSGAGGAGGTGMPDLSALMSQMQAMMQPHEGAVNWNLAKDVARRTVAAEPDPSPSARQRTEKYCDFQRQFPDKRPFLRQCRKLTRRR